MWFYLDKIQEQAKLNCVFKDTYIGNKSSRRIKEISISSTNTMLSSRGNDKTVVRKKHMVGGFGSAAVFYFWPWLKLWVFAT